MNLNVDLTEENVNQINCGTIKKVDVSLKNFIILGLLPHVVAKMENI